MFPPIFFHEILPECSSRTLLNEKYDRKKFYHNFGITSDLGEIAPRFTNWRKPEARQILSSDHLNEKAQQDNSESSLIIEFGPSVRKLWSKNYQKIEFFFR